MSEDKMTPGKWAVHGLRVAAGDSLSATVADCNFERIRGEKPPLGEGSSYASLRQQSANAHLIAASKELRAVCEALLLFWSGEWTQEMDARWNTLLGPMLGVCEVEATSKALCDAARAALAKATNPS